MQANIMSVYTRDCRYELFTGNVCNDNGPVWVEIPAGTEWSVNFTQHEEPLYGMDYYIINNKDELLHELRRRSMHYTLDYFFKGEFAFRVDVYKYVSAGYNLVRFSFHVEPFHSIQE